MTSEPRPIEHTIDPQTLDLMSKYGISVRAASRITRMVRNREENGRHISPDALLLEINACVRNSARWKVRS